MPLETAFRLFQSTLPNGRAFLHERAPVEDVPYGPDSKMIEVVRFREFRVSTSIRRIGGWTFLAENEFLTDHVSLLAKVWWWYQRSLAIEREALDIALRHCFKRFHAEASLGEHNNLPGRAMLVEAAVFERRLLRPVVEGLAADPGLSAWARDLQDMAGLIARHHEVGHYLLDELGAQPGQASASLLDGHAQQTIATLEEAGEHDLAEEAFCDAVAFQAGVDERFGPFAAYPLADRVRMSLFTLTALAWLSILSLSARQDARAAVRGEDAGAIAEDEFAPTFDSIRRRMWIVQEVAEKYAAAKDVRLFGPAEGFQLRSWPTAKLLEIFVSWKQTSEAMTEATLCDEEHRRLANFLALAMGEESDIGEYLLWCSREFSPDAAARVRAA